MIWLAAVLVALAVELWRPAPRRLMATRFGLVPQRVELPRISPLVAVPPVLLAGAVLFTGPMLVVAWAVTAAGVAGFHVVRKGRQRAAASAHRRESVEALSFLVSELRAGAVPEAALASVAGDFPALASSARAAAAGVDVAPVLTEASRTPGFESLASLAGAWRVADRAGAPVADVVARVVDRVRDELDLDREVEAELAPARATARIMALLPLAGLGLGSSMGGNPLHVITTSWIGAVSAAAGIGAAIVGLVWIERVAGSVPR